jgi:lipoprotein-anchoring transpeptidase ErfK/SrfK
MKKFIAVLASLLAMAFATAHLASANTATTKQKKPEPAIQIVVDISSQSMSVMVDGWSWASWKVSTARDGYYTPRGSWRPFALKKIHYSKKYDNAPMPNSIFFKGGYAIHATYYVKQLGRPASHGCIRLHPDNAAKLYALVQKRGMSATRITITE